MRLTRMDLGLSGQGALVTGGSRIGAARTRLFGLEGARMAVSYCSHLDGAESVAVGCVHGGRGSRLPASRAVAWRCAFFEDLGLTRLHGTIHYPGVAHATKTTW